MNTLLRYPGALALLGLGVGLFNRFALGADALGFLCISLYLAGLALLIQSRFSLRMNGAGLPVALAALMVLGSALYYTAPVSSFGLLVVCLAPLALTFKKPLGEEMDLVPPKISSSVLVLELILTSATALTLHQYAFNIAVRSPWDLIPTALVLLPFAALAALTIHAVFEQKREAAPAIMILLFLALMVTPIVYELGYGFDPFIHRATLEHIVEHGTITPKPFYYIGQYALELIGVRIFGISLATFDTWLVPLLASLLLPYSLMHIAGSKRGGLLALLILPLSPFIFTTPQSLSYLFFALTIAGVAVHMRNAEERFPIVAWVMALATLTIHPLSGIPALSIALAGSVASRASISAKMLFWLSAIGTALAIPALFVAQSALRGVSISLRFAPSALNILPDFTNHFAGWLDALYIYPRISLVLFMVLAAAGVKTLIKTDESALMRWSVASTIALLASYMTLSFFFEFSFLVESERANYANRLPYLALLAALPLLAAGMNTVTEYIRKRPIAIPSLIIALTLLATSNAYASFPRNDGESRANGFNVSALDYEAAESIHQLYEMGTYTVLANQSLSASALQAYGFTQYFHGDIFYYPIPTGGPLYELFLKMSNTEASRTYAKEAADLTGASHVVFVSHEYWSGSEAARERAKQESDKWYTVGKNQEIMIFLYDFSSPQ